MWGLTEICTEYCMYLTELYRRRYCKNKFDVERISRSKANIYRKRKLPQFFFLWLLRERSCRSLKSEAWSCGVRNWPMSGQNLPFHDILICRESPGALCGFGRSLIDIPFVWMRHENEALLVALSTPPITPFRLFLPFLGTF